MEVFLGFSPEAETAARANADRLESPPVPANAAEAGGPGTGTGAGALLFYMAPGSMLHI